MHDKKQPYVAKVALEMTFPEQRYFTRGVPLEVRAKGNGSSVPIANNTLPTPPLLQDHLFCQLLRLAEKLLLFHFTILRASHNPRTTARKQKRGPAA
jgi:hypothetical protein